MAVAYFKTELGLGEKCSEAHFSGRHVQAMGCKVDESINCVGQQQLPGGVKWVQVVTRHYQLQHRAARAARRVSRRGIRPHRRQRGRRIQPIQRHSNAWQVRPLRCR